MTTNNTGAAFSFICDGRSGISPGVSEFSATPTQPAGVAYEAINPRGKRRSPPAVVYREDAHLQGNRRTALMSSTADLKRNLSLLGWMLRRHCDYVARLNYQPRTGDRGFDRALRELMTWQSRREQMDRGGRLGREKFFRLLEMRRVLDGDAGAIRLRDGRLQFVKGDLIKTPPKELEKQNARPDDRREWESGIRIDAAGLPLQFGIFRRTRGGRGSEWARTIDASRFLHYGFFDDAASDQVRGISPITTAINDLRDIYESIDYAKVKVKLSQLLGIKFTRAPDSDPLTGSAISAEQTNPADPEQDEDEELARPPLDFRDGVATVDLDVGEDVDIFESKNPARETVDFLRLVLMIGLKALDLPYSFFDEKHTNFFGSRSAFIQYDRSALDKRDDQIAARQRWTDWQHQRWVFDGLLELPSGYSSVTEIRYDWIPKGMPWWKPSEEVSASLDAIAGGLDNPVRACEEFDRGDVFENIDRTLDVIQYAREQGTLRLGEPLLLSFEAAARSSAPRTPEPATPADDDENDDDQPTDDELEDEETDQ